MPVTTTLPGSRKFDGPGEIIVKPIDHRGNAPRFDFEDGLRPLQEKGFIHGVELPFLNFVEPFDDPEQSLEFSERQ
jgi:hypothetical protein